MNHLSISRRKFNQLLAGGLLAAGAPVQAMRSKSIQVAAIQMAPVLGDVASNMQQAESLIREAQRDGAKWIILPEMFTSGVAFNDVMLDAIQPFDGAPLKMLKTLAAQGNVVIGGSFLAERNGQVFNTFALVFPDGRVFQHDKDSPTYWENCYYAPGRDDGVMQTPLGPVGSVLCWELIRSRTARRLLGRVNLVVSGSCWWTLPDDVDADNPRRAANLKMLQEAPPRVARMLGVPVIHGSHAGKFAGNFSLELPDLPYDSSYLGEAMIVDAQGNTLAHRPLADGAGVVSAEISLNEHPTPSEPIPECFWMPDEMPEDWKSAWTRWLDKGPDYYESITLPYLRTGMIEEYIPEYLR